jgi:ATP-dependent Clp protease protease subunit
MISSYGGEAYTMLAMRDMIKSSSKPVATIAIGKAMSSGAFLLAAGSKGLRFASPDTAIMIHEVAAGVIGKTAEITETADTIKALNHKVIANLAIDCDKSYKYIESFLYSKKNADMMMTPVEAKRMGLIDNIGIPRIAAASLPTQLVNMPSHPAHVGSKRKKAKKP